MKKKAPIRGTPSHEEIHPNQVFFGFIREGICTGQIHADPIGYGGLWLIPRIVSGLVHPSKKGG